MKTLFLLPALVMSCLWSSLTLATTPAEAVSAHIAKPDRQEVDADVTRKPAELVAFIGVQAGMSVLDVGAGGGYATEIFSIAVGPEGKVYSQYNEFATKLMDGNYIAPLYKRTDNNRLPNVTLMLAETDAIPLQDEIDVVFWGNNLHDYYNRSPELASKILKQLNAALKSGGVLVITDHVGVKGGDNATTHRLDPTVIDGLLSDAGFDNLTRSSMYSNPNDDRSAGVFSPAVRGKTDRLVIKAYKP